MASDGLNQSCPNDAMMEAVEVLQRDAVEGEHQVSDLINRYPQDGRLQFLYGSIMAGSKRYDSALEAMRKATILAPYFWIARFQLGLLELTSGLVAEAVDTWRPLHELATEHALNLFATGLEALIREEFAASIDLLTRGIAANTENLPLNRDMQAVIERTRSVADLPPGDQDEPVSATQLLLQSFGRPDPTKH